MGIFGAMTTAITGLQAQAYGLERISDNIANSQTTGYKRSDTSFVDFVPDSPSNQQALGVVNAFSRPTNTIQGDISNVQVPTYMAINGDGYFIVAKQTQTIDGQPVFGGGDLYTRRGDFEFDSNGFLVNGAGYYLKGLAIDSTTSNPLGGTPEVIRLSNDFLPAKHTTQIVYRANLAAYPRTATADPSVPGSELLNSAAFVDADPIVDGTVSANDAQTLIDQSIAGGAITAYDSVGAAVPLQFRWAKIEGVATPASIQGAVIADPNDLGSGIVGFDDGANVNDLFRLTVDGVDYDFSIGTDLGEVNTLDDLVTAINATPTLNGLLTADGTGDRLTLAADNTGTAFSVGGDMEVVDGLGLTAGLVEPGSGGADTWNLFYLANSNASGGQTAWRNVGTEYVFGPEGRLNPPIASTTINGLVVNGVNLGEVMINHGSNGLTQFADEDGVVKLNDLSQNGYAAGEFVGVNISREGRVVASYTNGRSLDVAEVVLASFNGDNGLAKVDGGAFRATPESGEPIIGALGFIQGSALEGSNTDIADEFTKLIVTQQAYAANTRIISTADEMVREALNMIR